MTRNSTPTRTTYDRRTVLKAGVAAATTAAVGAGTASASATADADLTGWLENVGNFDGIVDETGATEVSVEVGAQGNNGAFAFGPAVIRVDPGTKVVWEWNGKGGSHNVVADDASFESEMYGNDGDTFDQTFDEEGVTKYYCNPHKAMGMKGVVLVGDVDVTVPDASGSGSGSSDGSDDGSDSTADVDYGDWFENVGNFDGTVDETGKDEVTITVGSEANGGAFGFGPAAVQVDPGTKVVWEWNGKGGSHNVVADDASFESEMYGSDGDTFEQTFDEEGVTKYYCNPHKAMGMKGAVVVGSGSGAAAEAGGEESAGDGGSDLWLVGLAGGLVTALLSPFLFGAFLFAKDDADGQPRDPDRRSGQHP